MNQSALDKSQEDVAPALRIYRLVVAAQSCVYYIIYVQEKKKKNHKALWLVVHSFENMRDEISSSHFVFKGELNLLPKVSGKKTNMYAYYA